MVTFLRTFCAAAAGAAAATLLLAPAPIPAAPLTGSAVTASAVSSSQWRSVRSAPGTVKAGDPMLHMPAQEVALGDIPSEKVQGVINRMIEVMRNAPAVSLAAPQIGVPLRIIVLEDTQEYIEYAPEKLLKEMKEQDRRSFDLLVRTFYHVV